MDKIKFLLFVFTSFFIFRANAQRIGFSSDTWKTIKTEHFDIIFTAEQQDLGLYYAQVAERAYQNLQTVFTERPERTALVINDSTDASNGYATRLPYPLIMAYPVQINDHESLSEAGEWARELITHEMTHILQFEPALGFYKYIRPIFGTIVAPNILLPIWWKEGMAVEMETQFSPRGRLRSNYQDATLRAMVLDKKLFSYTLASVNEMLPSWPFGMRPYLFGSLFWSQILKDKGISTADYIAQRHGERVPYFVEAPLKELTDDTYEAEYLKALGEVEENTTAQTAQLKKITPTYFEPLPIAGQTAQQPIYSKAHNLFAFIESKDSEPEITILNPDHTYLEPLKNRPTGHIDHIVFHPTLKQIYFTKIERLNSKQSFSDLYMYDIDADKVNRVTKEQRLRDPHFSEDGKKISFISTFAGKTQIKILDLESKNIEVVLDSKFQERFYSPIFWDAETLFFTLKTADGQQTLNKVNIKTKVMAAVPLKYKNVSFLKKIGDKLYFVSSENGVLNLYSTSDFQNVSVRTHSLTGIWSYAIDEKLSRMWVTMMTASGFRIAETKLIVIKQPLPVIENKISKRYQFEDHSKDIKIPEPEEYSASEYIWPHYWIPFISSTTTSTGVYLQAQTAGQDPLQIHRYSLMASYQTDINKLGFAGIYTNAAFFVPFQLGALQTNQTFGAIDQTVETKTNYFSLLPDMFFLSKNLAFQVGVQNQQTDYLGIKTEHIGTFAQVLYSNYSQSIYQISPEDGWGTAVRYENNKNISGSQDYDKATATLIGFTNWLLPKHHVLMTRLNGLVTFETVLARFGTSNSSGFAAVDTLIPQFVIRGYPASQFYGRSLWTTNTEYRFPVMTLEKGSGTNAFFMKRLSGAVVADGLGVRGVGIDLNKVPHSRELNETLWSAGLEAKLETTVGYVLPMTFVVGVYVPSTAEYALSPSVGVQIQMGGF